MTDKPFKSKINPEPDPKNCQISYQKYESDLKAYEVIEKLAAVSHDAWHFWSQSIMRDMDELVTALHELDTRLMESTITYEKSPQRQKVLNLITKHNERNARWQSQWSAYKQLPEDLKELDRVWAKKEYEALMKGETGKKATNKNSCKKCGTTLDKQGFCRDLTCPYSSWVQSVDVNDLYDLSREQLEQKYQTKKGSVKVKKGDKK